MRDKRKQERNTWLYFCTYSLSKWEDGFDHPLNSIDQAYPCLRQKKWPRRINFEWEEVTSASTMHGVYSHSHLYP